MVFYIIILAIILFAILEIPIVPVLIGVGVVIGIGIIWWIYNSISDAADRKNAAKRRAKKSAEAAKRQEEEKTRTLAKNRDIASRDPENYGQKYFRLGWYQEAIPLLKEVVEKGKSEADTGTFGTSKVMLARSLAKQGKKDQAKELWRTFQWGDRIQWGSYPQHTGNCAPDPIQWIVLGFRGDDLLLISSSILEARACVMLDDKLEQCMMECIDGLDEMKERYPAEAERIIKMMERGMTWDKADLRSWLNGAFLEKAFPIQVEKDMIPAETVFTPKNEIFETDGGESCRDKVFLLSIDEAKIYLPKDGNQIDMNLEENGDIVYKISNIFAHATASECTIKQGIIGSTASPWWLRSPGDEEGTYAYVSGDGEINVNGTSATVESVGVRPAIRLRLE